MPRGLSMRTAGHAGFVALLLMFGICVAHAQGGGGGGSGGGAGGGSRSGAGSGVGGTGGGANGGGAGTLGQPGTEGNTPARAAHRSDLAVQGGSVLGQGPDMG